MFGQIVRHTSELDRILALPRRRAEDMPVDLAATLTRLLKTPEGTQALRSTQALALHDIGTEGGLLGPIGVGEGKSLITLLAPYILDAKRPLLVLPAGLIRKTNDDWYGTPRKPGGYAKNWRIPTNIRLHSYEMLGRVQAAEFLETYKPDLLVFDECFVAGTQIRTPEGFRRIETLAAGDKVWAFDGSNFSIQTVEAAWSRGTDETWVLEVDGIEYETTANHPFLTERGWRRAADCKVGDSFVCDVREFVCRSSLQEAQVLQRALQEHQPCAQSERIEATEGEDRDGPAMGRRFSAAYAHQQPNEDAGGEGEGDAHSGAPSSAHAGGQRARDARVAASSVGGSGRGLGGREESAVGQEAHSGVPDRYLSRGREDCCRSGRTLAPGLERSSARQMQKGVPRATRLARLARIERRDRTRPEERCRVHNLQVSGPSTYVLEGGVVVHNCHKLKNKRAAVTRRVSRYLADHPEVKVIALSGTIMRRSLLDFGHILKWALKDRAPVPETQNELEEWAAALDEKVNELNRYEPGALLKLCPGGTTLEDARRGFRARLTETPGVVATIGDGERVDCSIYINQLRYSVSPDTDLHFKKLREEWCTPDDWELTQPVDIWRHAKELALGLYYKWDPRPPPEWRDARREWAAFVREVLSRSRTLDSELQVVHACDAGKLDNRILERWRKERDREPKFVPNTVAVWCDDSALNECLKWMKTPGLVWTEHDLFARRLAKVSGCKYYGARGLTDRGEFIDNADPKESAIASIDANREGRNLQDKWSRMLITSPMEGADAWQQTLGRLHRPGQMADEVQVDVMLGCKEHDNAWRRAIAAAQAIKDTTGADSKLLIADVDWPNEQEIASFAGARWR